MSRKAAARPVTLVLAALLVGACGVNLQDAAEPLPSGALRAASPAPSETSTSRDTEMCFVNGRNLERVPEPIVSQTAESVMIALGAGPPVDRGDDLRTLLLDPLTGAPVLAVAKVTLDGEVVVRHTEGFLQLSADDQILLIGQVACSMDAVGIDQVLLIDPMGQPAPIPLPDGRFAGGAVRADDYRALLIES